MRNQLQEFINNKPYESFGNSSFAHATVFAAYGAFKFNKNANTEKQHKN